MSESLKSNQLARVSYNGRVWDVDTDREIPTAGAPGDVWSYNDGREGHVDVRGYVLESDERGASVQWEDRADSTWIPWRDLNWFRWIRVARK